jgi:uncharacterized protein YcbX
MALIESLHLYPVAGMRGQEVQRLTLTPEAILGDRAFTVILEASVEQFLTNPTKLPTKLPVTRMPGLTALSAIVVENQVVLSAGQLKITVPESSVVTTTDKPFFTSDFFNTAVHRDFTLTAAELMANFAFSIKVSSSSTTPRWVIDCGDEVAAWLSAQLGQRVRLVKAVANPESGKHHFAWYTQAHAIARASLAALAEETGTQIEPAVFRPNIILSGDEAAFDEESWKEVVINEITALASGCQRCGYIILDHLTGQTTNPDLLKYIVQNHQQNFGVYLQPSSSLSLAVGDELTVKSRS